MTSTSLNLLLMVVMVVVVLAALGFGIRVIRDLAYEVLYLLLSPVRMVFDALGLPDELRNMIIFVALLVAIVAYGNHLQQQAISIPKPTTLVASPSVVWVWQTYLPIVTR